MELQNLCKYSPMFSQKEWSSEYCSCVGSNEITFTVQTDVPLLMKVIFSFNGISDGPEINYKINPAWNTRVVKRQLPYCKVVLLNESALDNNILILSVISDKKIKEEIPIGLPAKAPVVEEQKMEQRCKSPFSILSKRKKSVGREPQVTSPKCGCRIPELIFRNSLIVADFNNKLKSIPPPLLGVSECQILTFQNDQFEWVISNNEKTEKNVSWKFD